MHRTRAILAIALITLGLGWIGQGTGLLQGTGFMVGDMRWAWIGIVVLIVGIGLGSFELRSRRT